MRYSLQFSEDALKKLEALGRADAKRLKQVLLKTLSLRLNPHPQDSQKLHNFDMAGLHGYRVDQGEYRIVYAIDEKGKTVKIGLILDRHADYREIR